MDPVTALGAAGSVVGIASFGLQLCQALYQFTSEARTANESLVAVVSGIQATTLALNQVHGFLKEEVEYLKTRNRATFFTPTSIHAVKKTADECLVIFWKIEATIAHKSHSNIEEALIAKLKDFNERLIKEESAPPIITDKRLASMSIWRRLRWPMITYKLDQFNAQLQSRQANLNLIFTVVSLGAQRVKPNQRQEDLIFIEETFARLRRMAAQGELPHFEPVGEYRRKRKDLNHRTRPQLESPADDQLRADSLPIGVNANPLRRLSLSPNRHLSPSKYQPASSRRTPARSKDSQTRHYIDEPETGRSNLPEILSSRESEGIAANAARGIGSDEPIASPGKPGRKVSKDFTKSQTLPQNTMVSGGRSENDPIHLHNDTDHVYEMRFTVPGLSEQLTDGVESIPEIKTQAESSTAVKDVDGVDIRETTANNANEEAPRPRTPISDTAVRNGFVPKAPSNIPETNTVVLDKTTESKLKTSPPLSTRQPINNGLHGNEEFTASAAMGITPALPPHNISPQVPPRPWERTILPESRAEIPNPEIILEAPSQTGLESSSGDLLDANFSDPHDSVDNSMALVRYVPKGSTHERNSEQEYNFRPPYQSSENVPIVEVTSSEFSRIRRERREERRRRWASRAARTAASEDTHSISTTKTSYQEKRFPRLDRFGFAYLFKSLFGGKQKITSSASSLEISYDGVSEEAVTRNEPSKRFSFRFKSLFDGNEVTYDAVVSAYIIKNGESHQVPHSGTLRLTKQQVRNLESQSSQQPWYKLFAFLDDEDRDALKMIVSGGKKNREEVVKRAIIHLEKVREDRLKFWKVKNQALFALITDLFPEAPSVDNSSSISLVDDTWILPDGSKVYPDQRPPARNTAYNAPPSAGPMFPPNMPGPPPNLFPNAPGIHLGPPPPPPPMGGPQRGPPTNFPPPQPTGARPPPAPPQMQNSTIYRDMMPKVLDEAVCRAELTSYVVYNIRKALPRSSTESPTWAKSEITKEKLSQADILKHMKQFDMEGQTVSQKKAELSHYQQSQVTGVLDDLATKEQDRNFEWLLAQLGRVERPIQGTKEMRETMVILVFAKRVPLQSLNAQVLHQNFQRAKLGPQPGPQVRPQAQQQQHVPVPPGSGPGIIKLNNKSSNSKSKKHKDDSSFDSGTDSSSFISSLSTTSRNLRRRSSSRRKRYHTDSPTRSRSRSRYDRSNITRSRSDRDPVAAGYKNGRLDREADMRRYGATPATPFSSRTAPYSSRQIYDPAYEVIRPYNPGTARPGESLSAHVAPYNRADPMANEYAVSGAPQYPATNITARYERDQLYQPQPIIARPEMGPLSTTRRWVEQRRLDENSGVQRFEGASKKEAAAPADKNGKDIVQRLLLEWTPRNGDEAGKEQEESESEGDEPFHLHQTPDLTSPRSAASNITSQGPKVDSRQATVDDVLDETGQKRSDPRPKDVLSEDGNMIFPERGRQRSPKPIFKPRATSEGGGKPSWLDPSWAKQIVDTTSRDVEVPKRRGTADIGNLDFSTAPEFDPVAAAHQAGKLDAAYQAGNLDADAERHDRSGWGPYPPPPPPAGGPVVLERTVPVNVRERENGWAREDRIRREYESEREAARRRTMYLEREREREADEYVRQPRVSYNQSTLDREEARLRDLEREERIRKQDEEIRNRGPVPIWDYDRRYDYGYGRDRTVPLFREREDRYPSVNSFGPPRRRPVSRRYPPSEDSVAW